MATPTIHGYCDPRFASVASTLAKQLAAKKGTRRLDLRQR
jgi:hypothetical protein